MSTQSPLRLIVGLGNPGTKYQATRHNVGFWQVDHYAQDLKTSFNIEKTFFGDVAKAKFGNQNIYLLKPTTYMNRSGLSIQAVANFYKITPAEILVVHDELDLLPGQVKLKFGGSHAGHNGLKDTIAALGSQDFWRLRIGIGHPRTLQLSQSVADFVLHPPRREDQQLIDDVVLDCRRILPHFLSGDIRLAQQELGRR